MHLLTQIDNHKARAQSCQSTTIRVTIMKFTTHQPRFSSNSNISNMSLTKVSILKDLVKLSIIHINTVPNNKMVLKYNQLVGCICLYRVICRIGHRLFIIRISNNIHNSLMFKLWVLIKETQRYLKLLGKSQFVKAPWWTFQKAMPSFALSWT